MTTPRPPQIGETGYERIALDAYWTEHRVTRALLDNFHMPEGLWDPACGQGHIVQVAREMGYRCVGSDIHDHGFRPHSQCDFLDRSNLDTSRTPASTRGILTNPPYRLADEFLDRALEFLAAGSVTHVAMIFRVDFDSAVSRRRLFKLNPWFAAKFTLTFRPIWIHDKPVEPGEKKSGPRFNYSWFVWMRGRPTPPRIDWVP